jgi:hypothetical protein
MPLTISGDTPNFSAATITTGTVTTLTAPTSTITTLNAPSGVFATQNGMTGIAKAWVLFNGSTAAIYGTSFNVGSITKNGTGDYTINFTTAMANTNYAFFGSAGDGNNGTTTISGVRPGTFATGSIRVSVNYASSGTSGLNDYPFISASVFTV